MDSCPNPARSNVRFTPIARPTDLHPCTTPEEGQRGDRWVCSCHARWLCVNHVTIRPGGTLPHAHWVRAGLVIRA